MASYQYDSASRRTRLTWPDNYYVTYEYDAVDRLTAIKENGTDPDGQTLAVNFVGMPSCGSVTQSGNNLTFIAAGCSAGPANFTYGIADTVGSTAWAKVNVTVTN